MLDYVFPTKYPEGDSVVLVSTFGTYVGSGIACGERMALRGTSLSGNALTVDMHDEFLLECLAGLAEEGEGIEKEYEEISWEFVFLYDDGSDYSYDSSDL